MDMTFIFTSGATLACEATEKQLMRTLKLWRRSRGVWGKLFPYNFSVVDNDHDTAVLVDLARVERVEVG